MSRRWGVLCLIALPAWSQSVISVYSGVVNYAEGTVFLDNQPLQQKPGRFAEIKPGSELKVEDGLAEILLTPGVFLRMGEGSSIRMVSNLLVDTKVQIEQGPAIVDAAEPTPQTSVTMILQDYQVRIRKAGRYRFDTLPPQVRVTDGEAEVLAEGEKPVTVESGHELHLLSGVTMPVYPLNDELDSWDQDRSEAIARGNQEISQTPEISSLVDAAQNDPLASDPSLLGSDPGLLAPPLGSYGSTAGVLPPAGVSASSGYGSLSPYSPLYPYPLYTPYPYSLYSYSLYPYSLYPYSLGLYPYSLYPFGLYSLPGTIVVPYRYGSYGRIGSLGSLGISTLGIGSLGSGYRGLGVSTLPGAVRTPVYRPSTGTGIRTIPTPRYTIRPGRIGGVHR